MTIDSTDQQFDAIVAQYMQEGLSAEQAAERLYQMFTQRRSADQRLNALAVASAVQRAYKLTPLQMARLLKNQLRNTPPNVAKGLRHGYAELTATDIGRLLLDEQVYPKLTEGEMTEALRAADFSDEQVSQAIKELYRRPAPDLTRWAATYQTWLGYGGGGPNQTWVGGPAIVITPEGEVRLGDQPLRNVTFADNTLAWDSADGNNSQGRITFKVNDQPGYHWSEPVTGACFTGSVLLNDGSGWYDFRGLVPLGAWAATYQTWLGYGGGGPNQTWVGGPAVSVSPTGVVKLGDQPLRNVTFADNTLAWGSADGNNSQGRITFKVNDQPGYHWSEPVTGACFTGGVLLNDGSGWYDFRGRLPA